MYNISIYITQVRQRRRRRTKAERDFVSIYSKPTTDRVSNTDRPIIEREREREREKEREKIKTDSIQLKIRFDSQTNLEGYDRNSTVSTRYIFET
jgi:hypothetical protein